MREWVKLLLLMLVLSVYGAQALAAQHHTHELGERSACAACVLHDSPGVEPAQLVSPLARPPAPPLARAPQRPTDPQPSLTPGDVSPSTSPPEALPRVS